MRKSLPKSRPCFPIHRQLVRFITLFLVVFHAVGFARDPRPNIVFINADDLDFDEISVYDYRDFPSYTGMKAAGHSLEGIPLPLFQNGFWMTHGETPHFEDPRMLTPNIERLADEGAVFTRFYVTSAACTPSRYTTLTGRLASRNPQVLREVLRTQQVNIRWNTPILPEETSVIKELNRLGYATGMSGKWHNGSPGNIIGEWPDGAPAVYAEGVGPKSDPEDLEVIQRIRTAHDVLVNHLENSIGFDWAKTVSYENKERWTVPEELQVHNLEWITQGALDFLELYREEPFFLYVSLPVPHAHYYEGWEGDNVLATPRGFLSEIPDSQPDRQNIFDRLDRLGIDHRTSMGTWIDDSVGAILDRLDALGLAENTIVIFTSDHQARGKNTCYEGTRVPLIIRWRGVVRPGMTIGALAANTDFAPFLVEVAGGVPEPDMLLDGKSLLPLLTGKAGTLHDFVFLEMHNSRAVVTDRWKLLLNRVPEEQMVVNAQVWERDPEPIAEAMEFDQREAERTGMPRRVGWDGIIANGGWEDIGVWFYSAATFPAYFDENQLYDLEADPFEQVNLYDEPELQPVVDRLEGILAETVGQLPHPFGEFRGSTD